MPIAIVPNQTWSYVCRQDRELPTDKQTVFKLRALTKRERHAFLNLTSSREITPDDTLLRRGVEGDARCAVVRAGLVGWDNFCDADGKPVKFALTDEKLLVLGTSRSVLTDECLEALTDLVEAELYGEILSGSNLNHDDRKNSLSPRP